MSTIIYALLDPRSGAVRYVGKTKRALRARVRAHINRAPGQLRIPSAAWVAALAKDGLEPLAVELARVEDDWEAAEQFWIAEMRRRGADLLNQTAGGGATLGFRLSDAAKARLSEAARKQFSDPRRREAAAEYARAQWQQPGFREQWSAIVKAAVSRPEYLENQRAKKLALWKDPVFVANVMRGHASADHSGGAKRMWSRPEYRAKQSARLTPEARAAHGARMKQVYAAMTPEQKAARIDAAREGRRRAKAARQIAEATTA